MRKTNTLYHLYVGSKIQHKRTYPQNRDRLINRESRLVVARARGGGGKGWEWGLAGANY